ncbi:polyprenol phosphomannose-dependent alpha 1,6 mannosyltransferase MptB [Micromonospora sp. NPDC050397]|uniref:polyprenol phosphomannose-dependent alpha 1,6 mannosyltransferase MptB n=1 Tax=Micromonospora sp. NPDC050397 TaxID=3364279 RepID=UPI0038502425
MPGPEHPASPHPSRLRLAGLAGTALMAVGAYGAGALPGPQPEHRTATETWLYWLGLAGWLVGLVLLCVAWWRLGRSLTRPGRPPVTPRWLLLTAALWAVPLLAAPPTGSRDLYAYACQGALWLDGVDPYAVGVAAGGCPWTDSVPSLWWHTSTPYGPLAIGLAGAVVALARLLVAAPGDQLLVAVLLFRAVALAGALLLARYLPRLARACGAAPTTAVWLALLSPLTAVHLVGGAHNDAVLVGLVVAALALATGHSRPDQSRPDHSRSGRAPGRLVAAGVLVGLAVAVKVTAVVAVPFVALLALLPPPGDRSPSVPPPRDGTPTPQDGTPIPRDETPIRRDRTPNSRDRTRGALPVRLRTASAGLAVVLLAATLAFTCVTLATGLDAGWLGGLPDTGRMVQWTSLPTGLGMAVGYLLRLLGQPAAFDPAVAVARAIGLVFLLAVAVALVVRAWRASADPPAVANPPEAARRTVVASAGLAFGAVALLSPVFYPWYALATVAVLAVVVSRRWWRPLAATVLVLGFLVLPDGLGLATRTKLPGALFDVVLVTALVVFAVRARRRRRTVSATAPGPATAGRAGYRPRRPGLPALRAVPARPRWRG